MSILKAGDTIALIAPARAVSAEEMRPFKHWAEQHGLAVKEGKNLYGQHFQFSGTDEQRAADFIEAWNSDEIKAVFCARGGYGSMRWMHLVPEKVWETQNPKVFAGYSDITTLHFELNRRGYETLHCMMPFNFQNLDDYTLQNIRSLEDVLFKGQISYDISANRMLRKRPFEGELVGGNLSLLYAALATPEQPDTNGKILFVEDVDEYLYHIDRMLVSLKRAGLLNGLKALLVGSMHDMKDNTTPFGLEAEQIIEQHCAEYDFPVIFDFPAGHGPKNYCLKLNAYSTFDGYKFVQK